MNIDQKIASGIASAASQNRFTLSPITRHIHNGVDSPQIPGTSVTVFKTLSQTPGGVLSPSILNGQGFAFQGQLDVQPVLSLSLPIIYGSGTTAAITLTGTLSAGAVSATLTGAWGGITAVLAVQFDSTEIRNVKFTNGSTALTWTPALIVGTSTTGQTEIGSSRFHGGDAPDGTTLIFRNDDDGVLQLWTRSAPGIITESWAGVNLGGTGLFIYN